MAATPIDTDTHDGHVLHIWFVLAEIGSDLFLVAWLKLRPLAVALTVFCASSIFWRLPSLSPRLDDLSSLPWRSAAFVSGAVLGVGSLTTTVASAFILATFG